MCLGRLIASMCYGGGLLGAVVGVFGRLSDLFDFGRCGHTAGMPIGAPARGFRHMPTIPLPVAATAKQSTTQARQIGRDLQ
jgi:hypothetical protein